MKVASLFIINLFLCAQLGAQERFYKFVPGWRGTSIIEKENGYITIGMGTVIYNDSLFKSFITSDIDLEGIVLSEFESILDTNGTIEQLVSFGNNVSIANETIVVGHQKYDEFAFKGLLIWYNEDLSEINHYRKYDLSFNTRFSTINHPNDSTLLIGGYRANGPSPPSSIIPILINTDLDGNIRWLFEYPCEIECEGQGGIKQVLEINGNGYLIVIEQKVFQPLQWDDLYYQRYIKLDNNGEIQWEFSAGDINNFAYSTAGALVTDDGNILIAYSDFQTHVFPNNQSNDDATIYLEKLNIQDGSSMFLQPVYETTPWATQLTHIIHSSDGNIVLSGVVFSKAILLKVSQTGIPIWYREIDPNENSYWNYPIGLTETNDGGFICVGELRGHPNNEEFQSAFVLKVDEYGCLEPGCQLTDNIDQTDDFNASQLKVFPNPSSGNFTIYLPERKKGEITVMDIMGKIVLTKVIHNEQTIPIDISKNVSGLYLIQFTSNKGEIYQIKIIKN